MDGQQFYCRYRQKVNSLSNRDKTTRAKRCVTPPERENSLSCPIAFMYGILTQSAAIIAAVVRSSNSLLHICSSAIAAATTPTVYLPSIVAAAAVSSLLPPPPYRRICYVAAAVPVASFTRLPSLLH